MKIIPILTQALFVSILAACGSGSSDTPAAESFILDPYEGRILTANSLVGTWVYVKDGTTIESDRRGSLDSSTNSSGTSSATSSYKEYFIIRESEAGLEKSRCYSGFYSVDIDVGANELYLEAGHIAVVTNNTFSGVYEFDDGFDNGTDSYYRTESKTFKGIKISDSVSPFGSITNTIAGVGSITEDIYCFSQEIGKGEGSNILGGIEESGDFNFKTIQVGLVSNSDSGYFFNKLDGFSKNTVVSSSMGSFHSSSGANVNLIVNEESDFTYSMNYSGSNAQNDALDISGFIQIQLPTQ